MPISRTIREQVTCQIRDEVVAGELPAGSVLRETELAKRFGVSRGPIRDAFLQLSNEGYLAYEANRGVSVRHPPDQADRDFIADLRRQIEIYVATKGAEQADDAAIDAVREALVELEIACSSEDPAAIKRCDLEFHEALLISCGGESLIPAWKQLCSRMAVAYGRLGSLQQVYEEHLHIFQAFESRDSEALNAALTANIN